MEIRSYRQEDIKVIAELFYNTVHSVNAADYTDEQLDAWAGGSINLEAWDRSFREHMTLVAVMDSDEEEGNGQIVGFADMDSAGYLDRLYVHKDFQRHAELRLRSATGWSSQRMQKQLQHMLRSRRDPFLKREDIRS